MSTRTKILAAVAVLAVLVIALSRGEEPDARLQALKSDPTATYMPPGATLVDTKSENAGTSLGKPVPASYTRMFELDADAATDALDHARAAAVAAGWKVGQREPRAFVAQKTLPDGAPGRSSPMTTPGIARSAAGSHNCRPGIAMIAGSPCIR